MGCTYRLIPARDVDATLAGAWRSIQLRHAAFQSPYFCPEFTQAVAAVRGDAWVVVLEDGGTPVGFFPFQRAFLGVGKPVGGPLSDYHGVIAAPEAEWTVPELMKAAKLDVWTFDHLVDPSRRLLPHATGQSESPQMRFDDGFAPYLRSLDHPPSDFLRKARKLERELGELRFTLHEAGDEPLEAAIAWKRGQYRETGAGDVFSVRWTGELLRQTMGLQNPHFAGTCSTLRAGDRLVAVHAGMRSDRVLHWWFPAYGREFAKYSPGIILLFRLAEALDRIGIRTIDLGKGDERYKQSVMTGAVELYQGAVELPSIAARARRLRRFAETRAGAGGLGAALRLPLRVIRRIERAQRFR